MIKLTDKDKTLVVPSGLGNFGQGSGSGGGVTPEEAASIASAVTAEAIDEYDTELQVDLEDIRDAVSANTQDIAILSGLSTDIATISGQTTANTQDIGILSGVTSGLAVDIETLSGSVKEDVILDVAEIYNMDYNDRVTLWDETYAKLIAGHSVFAKGEILNGGGYSALIPLFKYHPETSPQYHTGGFLTFAAKSDEANSFVYYSFSSAGNISPNRVNFQQNSIYSLPTASSSTKGGVKVGSGLTMSGEVMSIKAGDGLGFSGDTLVVSGGTGGGPAVYYLDKMTQQERVALYNEIQSYTEQTFPSGDYRFFTYMVDNDEYQGNIELCVARFYDETPVSFSGIYQSRYSSQVLQRGYELASNGDFVLTFEAKVNINKPEPKRYVLNLMTQEERAALYTELSAYRYSYASVSSSFPVWDYSFYYWVGDQGSDPYNDKFSGFVPLDIALLHPGDYGGAVFFTGIVKTRSDGSTVIAVRYNMASDGSVEVFSDAISQ